MSAAVRRILTFAAISALAIGYVAFFYHQRGHADAGLVLIMAAEVGAAKVVADGNLAEKRVLGSVTGRTRFWAVLTGLGLIGMGTVGFLIPEPAAPLLLLWAPVVTLAFVGKAGYVLTGSPHLPTP